MDFDESGEVRHSNDIEAYHLFLKGRHFPYTKLDLKSAPRCFEEKPKQSTRRCRADASGRGEGFIRRS
jgi:hypothetical protein